MRVNSPGMSCISRKVVSLSLFGNARLERTFDCKSCEVVGSLLIAAPCQGNRFLRSQFGQALEISSSFCRCALGEWRHDSQGPTIHSTPPSFLAHTNRVPSASRRCDSYVDVGGAPLDAKRPDHRVAVKGPTKSRWGNGPIISPNVSRDRHAALNLGAWAFVRMEE
jgi:hypothetical protein